MKNVLLLALLLITKAGFGQCNQDVTLTSSKTEYLDGSGAVQRSVDEQSTIEISKSGIIITPGNSEHKMNGTTQSVTCNWATAFQEGKTVIQAEFTDPSGSLRHATMTIEGKAGQVTFLMEIVEMPDVKIRVKVDSFKEKK